MGNWWKCLCSWKNDLKMYVWWFFLLFLKNSQIFGVSRRKCFKIIIKSTIYNVEKNRLFVLPRFLYAKFSNNKFNNSFLFSPSTSLLSLTVFWWVCKKFFMNKMGEQTAQMKNKLSLFSATLHFSNKQKQLYYYCKWILILFRIIFSNDFRVCFTIYSVCLL